MVEREVKVDREAIGDGGVAYIYPRRFAYIGKYVVVVSTMGMSSIGLMVDGKGVDEGDGEAL